jgi:hypothetical protein
MTPISSYISYCKLFGLLMITTYPHFQLSIHIWLTETIWGQIIQIRSLPLSDVGGIFSLRLSSTETTGNAKLTPAHYPPLLCDTDLFMHSKSGPAFAIDLIMIVLWFF